jgi:phage-related protein
MSFGSASFGTRSYGSSPAITTPTQFPRLYDADQAVFDLQIQSPWLTFYDVTLAGSTIGFFVDFGDIEADDYAGLGEVTFDSNDYTTVKIEKTAIEESIDGSLPEITLTLADPIRTILNWVLDNDGLTSATVRMRMLFYSDIAYPARAIDRNFVVNRVISSEGPAAVTFILKAPDFSSIKFPRIFFGRHRCHNDWEARFIHDYKNYCSYPSDEFEMPTIQRFDTSNPLISDDTATAIGHGWNVINATKCAAAPSAALGGVPPPAGSWYERGLWVYSSSGETAQWDGSTRTGFFAYKTVDWDETLSRQLDVCAKLKLNNSYNDTMCGILVQSVDDASDWVFYGKEIAASTERTLFRETNNGISTDSTNVQTDSVLRLRFLTSACYRHSKDETLEDYNKDEDGFPGGIADAGWTSRGNDLINWLLSPPSQVNVGFVCCPDTGGSTSFGGWCFYFRFFAGGAYQTCDRTLTACTNRSNAHQFNGYPQLPDGIISY